MYLLLLATTINRCSSKENEISQTFLLIAPIYVAAYLEISLEMILNP